MDGEGGGHPLPPLQPHRFLLPMRSAPEQPFGSVEFLTLILQVNMSEEAIERFFVPGYPHLSSGILFALLSTAQPAAKWSLVFNTEDAMLVNRHAAICFLPQFVSVTQSGSGDDEESKNAALQSIQDRFVIRSEAIPTYTCTDLPTYIAFLDEFYKAEQRTRPTTSSLPSPTLDTDTPLNLMGVHATNAYNKPPFFSLNNFIYLLVAIAVPIVAYCWM